MGTRNTGWQRHNLCTPEAHGLIKERAIIANILQFSLKVTEIIQGVNVKERWRSELMPVRSKPNRKETTNLRDTNNYYFFKTNWMWEVWREKHLGLGDWVGHAGGILKNRSPEERQIEESSVCQMGEVMGCDNSPLSHKKRERQRADSEQQNFRRFRR